MTGRPSTDIATRYCESCGAALIRRRTERPSAYTRRRFCSPACAGDYGRDVRHHGAPTPEVTHEDNTRTCPACGRPLRRHHYETARQYLVRRYCSRSCGATAKAGRPLGPNRGIRRPRLDTSWHNRAACRDEDPELFFPEGQAGGRAKGEGEAKAVCRHCPVRRDCLAWALLTKQEHGVWGGTTEEERKRMKAASA